MAGTSKTERPFRIWDESALRDVPWRCYATEEHAVEKALTLLYWLELGNSYTVYDSRSSRVVVQFIHKLNGIHYVKV